MKILGIETSCDETAAAVVEDGQKILSNAVVSQIDIFAEYGGVIPEVAARSHLEVMMPVVEKAMKDAECTWDDIDAIAVTYAPGLLGSLLIGTLTARTLAILHDKPLYAVHHLKSHVYANWLGDRSGATRGLSEATAENEGASPVTTGRSDPSRGKSYSESNIPTIELDKKLLKDTWRVEKLDDKFVVTGEKIEKFARRTDLNNYASVNRLRDIMKKMGIRAELTTMGAEPDSIISIAGKEFTLVEDY